MRSVGVTLAGLGLAASAAAGTVSVSFNRRSHNEHRGVSLTRRDGGINLDAVNNITGGGYYSEFEVGSPGQKLSFLLDTGSSDTWVNSVDADVCNSASLQAKYGYCQATFDPQASDSFKYVDRGGFDITYLDGRNIKGSYFNDTVTIGDSSVENQQLGLATDSVRPTGIMGLGFDTNVASRTPYATIIDNMLSQGLINTAAFSLYLNDLDSNDGTILFGGVDKKRFVGNLAKVPIISDEQTTGSNNITSYAVKLQGFKVSGSDDAGKIDSFSATAVLDSGSTISLLPDSQVSQLWDLFDVRSIDGLQVPFIDCAWAGSKGKDYKIDFEFDGKTISVPLDQMVIDSFAGEQEALQQDPQLGSFFDGFDSVCMFGVGAASEYGVKGDSWALLGDTFLRSAYVVYDLSNEQLGLAQANLNATDSDIVAFGDDSDIPDVSGVQSQEASGDEGAAGHLAPPLSAVVTLIMLMGGVMALL